MSRTYRVVLMMALSLSLLAAVLYYRSGAYEESPPDRADGGDTPPAQPNQVAAAPPEVKPEPRPRQTTATAGGPRGAGVFTRDGRTFLTPGDATMAAAMIHAWNVADGKLLYSLKGPPASAFVVVALVGDDHLVSAAADGNLLLWDLAKRKTVAELPRQQSAIRRLAASRSGKLLATVGGQNLDQVRLWDLQRRQEIAVLAGNSPGIWDLDFSPDDRLLAAVDQAQAVRIWDTATRKLLVLPRPHAELAVRFSPDGKYLATARDEITLWDTVTWSDEGAVKVPTTVGYLGYARSNMLVSVGLNEGGIDFWDPAQLEEQPRLHYALPKGTLTMANLSPDGKTLALTDKDGLVHFWPIPDEAEKRLHTQAGVKLPETLAQARTGPARIALLTSQNLEAARNLQDLSLAKLSTEPGIQLLERAAIERVLREQALSLSGLVDAGTAVKVGQLLAVDVLGIIDSAPAAKSSIGLVVFDAASGVRLADIVFSQTELEAQAAETAAVVRSALAKWRAGLRNVKTVCFLPVRNADLPRSMDEYCQALSASLERHLVQHPGFVTLERKRLEAVTQEKELSAAAATRALLASVLHVELEIGRVPQGPGVRAMLVVRSNGGDTLHKITHEVADANGAELLGPVLDRLHAALKTVQGQGVVNRTREAHRFVRQAQALWNHGQYRLGVQAAEAAYALKAEDTVRLRLADYLSHYAVETCNPGVLKSFKHAPFEASPDAVRQSLSIARRAFQLIDSARDAKTHRSPFRSLDRELRYLRLQPPDTQIEQDIHDFLATAVERHVQRARALAERMPPTSQGLHDLTKGLGADFAPNVAWCAPDGTVVMKAYVGLLNVWLDAARRFSADDLPADIAEGFALWALRPLLQPVLVEAKPFTYSAADRELSLPVLEAMQQHPHPVMRLYAAHYQTRQLLALGRMDNRAAEQRYQAGIAEAKRWIDEMPFKPADRHRTAFYYYLRHVLREPPAPGNLQARTDENLAAAEFSLSRRDVMAAVWFGALEGARFQQDRQPQVLQLLERMIELEKTPPHRLYVGVKVGDGPHPYESLARNLEIMQDRILEMSPHLAKDQAASPWDKVGMLVDQKAVPQAAALVSMTPARQGQDVFVLAAGLESSSGTPFLQLVRATRDGGAPRLLGKAFLNLKKADPKQGPYGLFVDPPIVHGCVVHGERLYAATVDGIHGFPLSGGDAVRIGDKEGLPSLNVLSLTAVDDHVVAVLEGGYIVSYDLDAQRCDVIVSSRRTERLSPFDNAKGFVAGGLTADSARHRVLLAVSHQTEYGVWEYNLKARAFKRLLTESGIHMGSMQDGAVYLKGIEWKAADKKYAQWLGRFELEGNKLTRLTGMQQPAGLPANFSAVFPLQEQPIYNGQQLYHAGYLWTANRFRRQPIQGGTLEYLRHPAMPHSARDVSLIHIEAVAPKELLLIEWRGVYLVRLR